MQISAFYRLRFLLLSALAAQAVQPPAPPPAAALPADSGWTSDAAAQLTHLEEETMLLKAQIKKLDAQAEVAQRTAALSRLGSGAALDPAGQSLRVVSIEGFGRRYSAVIQTGDGQRFDVAAGDVLPNGLRIVSIGANEVIGRWGGGQTARMIPVMASRSGAVLNPGTGAAGALAPADRNAVPGLPPGYPSAQ
jgi:type IV pilus biogenesis protein PilP